MCVCGGGGGVTVRLCIQFLTKHLLVQNMKKNFDFTCRHLSLGYLHKLSTKTYKGYIRLGQISVTFIRRTTVLTHSKLLKLFHFVKNQFQNFLFTSKESKNPHCSEI